ncbi:MAG: PDZ domain-containing protein [Gammaproteobacteria bacterium]
MKAIDVEYHVECLVHQHIYKVTCKIRNVTAGSLRFSMPRWIPGSYLIRHFAKNIISLNVLTPGLKLEQIDTANWDIVGTASEIELAYEIYAFDASVRGVYLDNQRGFINPSRICLQIQGKEHAGHRFILTCPKQFQDWEVATTLPVDKVDRFGFGSYQADGYDELIDHPIEIGKFERVSFAAAGVPHEIVMSGRFEGDVGRLAKDLEKICTHQIEFFGQPAPFQKYLFILNLVGEGYGGLEHRSSTALQATRDCLPISGIEKQSKEYVSLLGLFSHEYFHAWNVKRIKPACFIPYNLLEETPTSLLWVFEGFTTYYDDLMLVRSGVISEAEYLRVMSEMMSRYIRTPGRYKQTLIGASFEAWTKFYQPDENSPNSQISYYLKGCLAALCLDLTIRKQTQNKRSLDDVMRWLWTERGLKGIGVADKEVEQQIIAIAGESIVPLLNQILYSTESLPLESCLGAVDLAIVLKPTPKIQKFEWDAESVVRASMGISLIETYGRYLCQIVYNGSAAERAGLSANDELVAINGIKVTPTSFEKIIKYLTPEQTVMVHVFRRDELLTLSLVLDPIPLQTVVLSRMHESVESEENLKRWLG